MKKYLIVFLLLFVSSFYNNVIKAAAQIPNEALEGRWDITVNMGSSQAPSWLEVRHSGLRTLIGRFVGDGGSARPISQVFFKDGKLSFHIPPQWDNSDKDLYVEGELKDGKLSGTMTMPSGKTYTWTGVRAPKLWRDKEPVWGNRIVLFNGKNLDGWQALGNNQWVVENGILRSPHSGSNIRTVKTFNDFKLHIEFRYPKESNSGVYLRGRYEVQIMDSKGMEPLSIYLGGIYGFIDPLEMVAKDPGEWQSYDITLVGRLVTVVANGKTIIYKQQIPGITGGALDSNEAEPGPIYMQGDHGPIDFRNIVITPAK
ncbi:hypothetical protein GALL_64300 [mine drainage metagenome]|uniref:3-keto-alpha-glucoside-1,2-lyase/3-keto-2-hydroxy-glucal hydratase domain-containing protein n=1 Tax=mine drainage metagenome TaxID=410659 RepID=A0A1J5SW31_9ZZZZ